MEPVVTPSLDDSASTLVDWLELIAFFNQFGLARLDVLQAALDEQEPEQEDDIGERDRKIEVLLEAIENEIDERREYCGGGYPFELSDDAEELNLVDNWEDDQFVFYIVCLLTTHIASNKLFDFEVDEAIVQKLRNGIFQVISTIAMGGMARGSAASIGWPRQRGEDLLEVLRRAARRGSGFSVRDEPGIYTPPSEKDGGIDVISWSASDRPPPEILYFGQVASGQNWRGKPVQVFVEAFKNNYFEFGLQGNQAYATCIPFRETETEVWFTQHTHHGALLDRTRLSKHGRVGLQLIGEGSEMDEMENIPQVKDWISEFKNSALS